MIENPPDTPLVAAIYDELAHGCHGLPAKRAALFVALTLTKPRNRPCELDLALGWLDEIRERIRNVKVV